jgi:hypothetical protein
MKPTTRDGILRGGIATSIRLLLLAAGGISGYLVVDLALLVTTFSCGSKSTTRQRRGAWEILVPCAVLLLGAALWFTALQAFVLHRFCPWCLAAHACGAVAAALLLTRVPVTDTPREKDAAVARPKLVKLAAIALSAVAALGIAQTLAPGKTYSVTVIPAAPSNTVRFIDPPNVQANAMPVATSSAVKTNVPAEVRPAPATNRVMASTLDVFGGRVRLDLTQVPVWGPPDAPHKLISLFDYTCSHCREMHERVTAVQRSFSDKLAVVSLPMPLDSQCNRLITRTHPKQTNACLYARLGLAVWHAKREAIIPFDDWFFASPNPPPLNEATNKAVQLVGAAALESASRNPLIEEQIKNSIELFTISMREYRNGSMPQFMIGTNILSGTLTTEQLRAMVAKYVEGGR